MSEKDEIDTAKDSISIVSEIIKAAGESPEAKEAAKNIGKTAVIITNTINNALMPLAAINFAFDKAREYFANRFQSDLAERASSIPPEYIIEPKASIAGPTLQGLAFTHQEPSLKEMFLSLLATSMDGRVADEAHPAFVEVIKQLNSSEADLIRAVLVSSSPIAIAQVRTENKNDQGHTVILRHLLNLQNLDTQQQVENLRLAAIIDNWTRLGLVEVEYGPYLTEPNAYDWVDKRNEYIRLSQEYNDATKTVKFEKGYIVRTEFGKQFAKAVAMI